MNALVVVILVWSLTAALLFHAVVYVAAASWHTTNTDLAWSDRERLERRNANRPWYVRYPPWLEVRATRVVAAIRWVVKR